MLHWRTVKVWLHKGKWHNLSLTASMQAHSKPVVLVPTFQGCQIPQELDHSAVALSHIVGLVQRLTVLQSINTLCVCCDTGLEGQKREAAAFQHRVNKASSCYCSLLRSNHAARVSHLSLSFWITACIALLAN